MLLEEIVLQNGSEHNWKGQTYSISKRYKRIGVPQKSQSEAIDYRHTVDKNLMLEKVLSSQHQV